MRNLKVYAVSLVVLLVLDGLWLTVIAANFFQAQIGGLLRPDPNFLAAAAFYLIYTAGVAALCVLPSMREGGFASAARRGAILGLTAYATFDLSNLAILKGWTPLVAAVDIAWGIVVTTLVAVAGTAMGRRTGV